MGFLLFWRDLITGVLLVALIIAIAWVIGNYINKKSGFFTVNHGDNIGLGIGTIAVIMMVGFFCSLIGKFIFWLFAGAP